MTADHEIDHYPREPGWDVVPRLRDLLDQWQQVEPESPAHVSDLELERNPTPLPALERARSPR